jgi:hypothetical protein
MVASCRLTGVSFRSITFEYAEDVEVHGVTGYRFELGKRLLDNGTIDRGNWCNCGGQCVPQGTLNVSSCRHGAPAFVSYPHYLDADPYYTRLVTGMNPDQDRHRFYLTLEPVSGNSCVVKAHIYIYIRWLIRQKRVKRDQHKVSCEMDPP